MIDKFKAAGIDIPANINSGQHKIECPRAKTVCQRKNHKEKCLSVNLDEGLYNCQHCPDFKGKVGENKISTQYTKKKEYTLPQKPNITKLTDLGLAYFTGRMITQEVVKANEVAEENGWVVYPYKRGGTLVNFKKRSITAKDFRQASGAEPIIFNYNRVLENVTSGNKEIIITEGEEDAMSWEVAGFTYHTSMNQGAPGANDTEVSGKLACIDNCYEVFEKAKVIFIAVDNDPNGKRLEKELIRRFGEEKCKLIEFGKYKDTNETLKFEGAEYLKKLKDKAKFVQIAEVYTAADAKGEIVRQIDEGREKGTTTYFPDLDNAWKWRKKEVNLWSGYANEGKSILFLQLALLKVVHEGWKFGVFSPENFPVEEFFDDLIQMYVGKPTDKDLPNHMSREEAEEALDFLENHFYIVYPENNYSLEHIHIKFKALIKRHGIDGVLIDPYNWLQSQKKAGQRDDQYVTEMMTGMKRFANEQNISYNLVAHQNKPDKKADGNYMKPDPYKIKGAGDFMDKADNVLLIQRPFVATDYTNTLVEFTSAKIKKPKLVGKRGLVIPLLFDYKTMRYHQEIDNYCPLAGRNLLSLEVAQESYARNDVFKTVPQSGSFFSGDEWGETIKNSTDKVF